MDDNFGGVITKEWHKEDMRALTSQLKEHESVLRLKRRWLMDLPLSTTEETGVEVLMSADKILPESLLREDDVGYENIKICIEMGFGVHKPGKEQSGVQEDIQIFKSREDFKDIFFLLDSMTNKGLCSFAGILTEGMIKFEKTNWCMKRTIKEHLREKITDEICTSEIKLKQLSQLVVDPANFRGQMVVSTSSEAYYDAANRVLDGLEDLCSRTLNAMRRKLEGIKGFIPTMQTKKSGKGRDSLISLVRKRSMKMLSDLGKGGEPAEQLTSALGVAGLALKHLLNRPVAFNFRNFLPEAEALQIDIVKAIWLLNESKRVSIIDLKKVQALLDPNVELSARSLRMGVRNLLIEYLFECSDMDKVPGCLMKTLDIINGKSDLRSHGKTSSAETHVSPRDLVKEEMQKEVECILTVSGQAKEVLLDWLPEHAFDEDFAHAYMEDLEESDTLFTSNDDDEGQTGDVPKHSELDSHNSHSQAESIGETIPVELNSPVSTSNTYGCSPILSPNESFNTPLESTDIKEMDLDKTPGCDHSEILLESEIQCGQRMNRTHNSLSFAVKLEVVFPEPLEARSMQNLSSLPPSFAWNSNKNDIENEEPTGRTSVIPKFEPSDFLLEQKDIGSHQRKFSNPYLDIQEACDATSMVAYRFVGHMLDELAMTENIELYQGDKSYLLSGASIPENSEECPQTLLTSRFRGIWKDVLER